jgi:hypothetical protein
MIVKESVTPAVVVSTRTTTICQGSEIIFTATPENAGLQPIYQWQVNGFNVGSNASTFRSNRLINNDEVKVLLTGNAPCSVPSAVSSNVLTINVTEPSAVITFSPAVVTIPPGGAIQLNPRITGIYASLLWTPSSGLNNPTIVHPIASPASAITYLLQVMDGNGCVAENHISLKINGGLHIPNSFTPNGDGNNDVFRIPTGRTKHFSGI